MIRVKRACSYLTERTYPDHRYYRHVGYVSIISMPRRRLHDEQEETNKKESREAKRSSMGSCSVRQKINRCVTAWQSESRRFLLDGEVCARAQGAVHTPTEKSLVLRDVIGSFVCLQLMASEGGCQWWSSLGQKRVKMAIESCCTTIKGRGIDKGCSK